MRIHMLLRAGLALIVFSVLCTATYAQPDDDLPQGQIAFMWVTDYTQSDIVIMNLDGTNRQNLTNSDDYDAWPAWSPDGAQIAFASRRGDNEDIFVMNADGTDQRQLTHHPGSDSFPSWSPDGEQIIFSSDRGGNDDLYIMNADGSNPVQITDTEQREISAAWSPDGTYIAYIIDTSEKQEHSREYSDDHIVIMHADGSQPVTITQDQTGAIDLTFTWSPDSRYIAYSLVADGTHRYVIYVFDVEEGTRHLLPVPEDFPGGMMPTWSPDGRFILYRYELVSDNSYLIPVDGSAPPVIVPGLDYRDHFPVWRPAVP